MRETINIAVGRDALDWHDRFVDALEQEKNDRPVQYNVVNMEAPDWMQHIKNADMILWKPHYMGIKSSAFFKEKIYFLQHELKKVVVPNFETVWHFESKAAQHLLFQHHQMKTPKTTVFMDHHASENVAAQCDWPVVFKQSSGAAGKNVELISNKKRLMQKIKQQFAVPIYDEQKQQLGSGKKVILKNFFKKWLWIRNLRRLYEGFENVAVGYLQQFIPENKADLRVTVIGDQYAFAFWRKNRPHDFRASGSGIIDYQTPIPEEPVRYCLKQNKKLNFDSMCYDILFCGNNFVITEMSYGYKDFAVHDAPGYFYLQKDGSLTFKNGHYWPQQLWVQWALQRFEAKHKNGV